MDVGGNNICMSPFSGLTIGPRGDIQLCCMAPLFSLGKLQEVDDLEEFYNSSPQLVEIRRLFSTGQYGNFEPCTKGCYNKEKAGDKGVLKVVQETGCHNILDYIREDYEKISRGEKVPIRFLEVTTSNQCQATCTMCSSQFSSQWGLIEEETSNNPRFKIWRGHENQGLLRIEDPDIEKIVKVIPEITHFSIKGGEPFADIRNIYLLEKFAELNLRNAQIDITTNAGILTNQEFFIIEKILEKGCNVHINCSIDNVGKLYEYIRSIPFERSIRNVKKMHDMGCHVNIFMTHSVWNWFNFGDFLQYAVENDMSSWVSWICAFNFVWGGPFESDPRILSEELFNKGKEKSIAALKKWGPQIGKFDTDFTISAFEAKEYKMSPNEDAAPFIGQRWILQTFIDMMKNNRRHDILELVPEIRDYYFHGKNLADYEWPMSNGKTLCFDKYGKQYERESRTDDWDKIKQVLPENWISD